MSYDDDDFMRELERAVAQLPVQPLTPAQIAVRRRNHERLIRHGLIKPDKVKVYIHERPETATCQFGWAEHDTMAPHQVRHECELRTHHDDNQHVCTCGLTEVEQ